VSNSIVITLKSIGVDRWRLFASNDIPISEPFHGTEYYAMQWAKNWVSSWSNWIIQIEEKREKD
jgi:hypothetical protein